MSNPAVLDIANAAVAQLKAAGLSLVGDRVYHVIAPPSIESIGGVVVTVERARPIAKAIKGHPIAWDTMLRIDCASRYGVDSLKPHQDVSLMAGSVFAALIADESLGGAADAILPGPVEWDYGDPEKQIAICVLRFTVMHQTDYGVM